MAHQTDRTLKAIQREIQDLPPLIPDYGDIFWNPEERKIFIESSDGDDSETLEHWITVLEEIPGVDTVECEAEHVPEEIRDRRGQLRAPWVAVGRSGLRQGRDQGRTGRRTRLLLAYQMAQEMMPTLYQMGLRVSQLMPGRRAVFVQTTDRSPLTGSLLQQLVRVASQWGYRVEPWGTAGQGAWLRVG